MIGPIFSNDDLQAAIYHLGIIYADTKDKDIKEVLLKLAERQYVRSYTYKATEEGQDNGV